ncbi:MAG: DUF6039 family protein [Chloroflexota bacterium]
MIYQTITFTAKSGKMQDARQLLLELVAYANKNYSDMATVEVLSNINGPANRLHWLVNLQSLGDWEVALEKWSEDSEAEELWARIPDVFEDDFETNLFRVES